MSKIYIDKEKCVICGSCIKECITYSLEQDAENFPIVAECGETNCISCQHCFAVCPTGAISFNNKKSEEAFSPVFPNSSDVLDLIRSRRSIRQFKEDEISEKEWDSIKEMLPYIPTGCNYNGLHFSIVESKSAMDKIRAYVNTKVLKLISNKFTKKYAGKFVKFKSAFEKGEDIIFRDAPHMIVVSSHIHAPCANVDPIIALSYIELYAQSLGLGTCWCGFAQACFKLLPRLSQMVDIPDGYKPVYVMLIGKPAVKYHRTIIPEKFSISEVTEVEKLTLTWGQRFRRILLNFIR